MKKLLIAGILLVASTPVFAEGAYFTSAFNLGYGIGNKYDYSGNIINPGIGYYNIFGYGFTESLALEGTLGFSYFIPIEEGMTNKHITYYEIPFYFGINYKLNQYFGLIGGLGMACTYIEFYGRNGELHNDFAFYLGTEFNLSRFVIRPYFQFINTPGDSAISINLSLGFKFGG